MSDKPSEKPIPLAELLSRPVPKYDHEQAEMARRLKALDALHRHAKTSMNPRGKCESCYALWPCASRRILDGKVSE